MRFYGQSGQAMLITVLILSGTMLAATTVAGLLMTYQIRQATNITDSTKAIFAADAGIEWALYRSFKNANYPMPTFGNGASVTLVFTPPTGFPTSVKSTGNAGKVARAFELTFE